MCSLAATKPLLWKTVVNERQPSLSIPAGGGGGGGGGGGDSHMKWMGMLVVSLRGVNFGFWSRLGCSGQNVIIFSRQGFV